MYSDHELVTMTQQYTRTRDTGEYICHLAYSEINKQAHNGRQWAKCMDCGQPYPMDRPDSYYNFCSMKCAQAYEGYM